MKVLQFRECPDCGRMAPYMQTACDCGYRFSGSERLYKTCPHCGALNPSTRILCDCGHFVLSKQSKLTTSDVENAYNSGRVDGMMEERNRNAAEWKKFFEDACLKNTITGGPIQSLEDFRQWKKQFDAAKAERTRTATIKPPDESAYEQINMSRQSQFRNTITGAPIFNRDEYRLWKEQVKSRKKEQSDNQNKGLKYCIMSDGEVAQETILSCSNSVVCEICKVVTPSPGKAAKDFFTFYTIPGLLCALSENLFYQTDSLTKDVIEFCSSFSTSGEPQKQWEMEAMMWQIHDSLKIELDMFRRKENPLVVFMSILQELLFMSFSPDLYNSILDAIKNFGDEYTRYFTYDRITQYRRPTPSYRKMKEYLRSKEEGN